MTKLFMANSEGYPDPTAFYGEQAVERMNREAQKRADQELEKDANRAVGAIKLMLKSWGFELVGRVTLRDKKTGKEFR